MDETVGNFLNVSVLPYADVVVSSLTKVFSGDSNVMGGSAILNPDSRYYQLLKKTWQREFEDRVWPEDAIFLERNSRDYVGRIERINRNAEALCERLQAHPRSKQFHFHCAITHSSQVHSQRRILPQSRPFPLLLRRLQDTERWLRRSSLCYILYR